MAKRARRSKAAAVAPVAPPNRGATAVPNPPAEAVGLFEQGLKAIQQHDYERGGRILDDLIERFPAERALLDRARIYREHCAREQAEQAPRTVEERLTAATAALNADDDDQAEQLAKAIVAEQPRHDLALYLLAVVACRRDQPDVALEYLRKAIDISPEAAAQARLDEDFEPLREHDTFVALTAPPVADETADTH